MGGCVVIARKRPSWLRSEPVDSGDGGMFAALGLAFLAFLVLFGVTAAVNQWVGAGAAEPTFEMGVIVIVAATLVRIVRGGRR
jgi:hypothetical protein